ncbi:MAG: FN3 associated domain-containing protein, partial [Verrucomicrobiales bacterium]
MLLPPRFSRGTPVSVLVHALVAGLMIAGASAAPIISEFLTINSGEGLLDQDGDSSDWVEIYNPDAVGVDLAGYGLSDDEDRPMRWQFPAVTLEPGGYLVVFASGKNRDIPGMELHTNFSLDGDGEYLGLSGPDGVPISGFAPEFPEQQRDTSFGVGSGGNTGYLLVPTPGAANGEALVSLTEAPSFSVAHGYFDRAVVLEITAAPGSQILYTTDGSVPTRLNGQVYKEPLEVGSTTIFRAVATLPDAVPSAVVTSSYIFPADIKNQARMSQLVVAAPEYADEIEEAIAALPAISLAMSEARFLGPDGIYT